LKHLHSVMSTRFVLGWMDDEANRRNLGRIFAGETAE
jgi:hypothetical protein